MIKKQDLLEAIAECQGVRSPNANTAIKLAAFYTILDHLEETETEQPMSGKADRDNSFSGYSFADSGSISIDSGSDFAKAINGRPQAEVLPVLDELMSTIKVMNERLYNGVMRRLS